MKIAYVTNVRLPTERAHGHQVAQMTSAIAALGHEVTILAPYRRNVIKQDFWSYHAVDHAVSLVHLGAFDPVSSPFIPRLLGIHVLNWQLKRGLRRWLRQHETDLLYTRTPALMSTLLKSGARVILELHSLPRLIGNAFVTDCNHATRVVCLTSQMRNELAAMGVQDELLYTEGDAVDFQKFSALSDRKAARGRFHIPDEAVVVGYAGSFRTMGLSKGVDQIVNAVASARGEGINAHAVLAGGPETAVKEIEALAVSKNVRDAVHLAGQLPHDQVPELYAAADLLIYPAPASDHPYFRRDTSPLKLMEYMATGRPAVSADIPPVHDAASDLTVTFYPPGDSEKLAQIVCDYAKDSAPFIAKAARAADVSRERGWKARAERILAGL